MILHSHGDPEREFAEAFWPHLPDEEPGSKRCRQLAAVSRGLWLPV